MSDEQVQRENPRTPEGPSRHAIFMRGVVTPVFGLLAVACIVFGILNATIWKPTRHIVATTQADNTEYVVTDPGVLSLVDQNVHILAEKTNPVNQEICIAIGSGKDATGWMQGHGYDRISGLTDWSNLKMEPQKAQGTPDNADNQVNFKDSNLWTKVSCATGSVGLDVAKAKDSQVALIDFGDNAKSAKVTMTWDRSTIPDFAMPLYVAGGLCAILAVLSASVFAMPGHKRRKQVSEEELAEQQRQAQRKPDVKITEAVAGSISSVLPGKRKAKKDRPRRRHAKGVADESETQIMPAIVDPHNRNMLDTPGTTPAESSEIAPASPSEETATDVITQEELDAYFARLNKEISEEEHMNGEVSLDATQEVRETESTDSAHDSVSLTETEVGTREESTENSVDDYEKFKPKRTQETEETTGTAEQSATVGHEVLSKTTDRASVMVEVAHDTSEEKESEK